MLDKLLKIKAEYEEVTNKMGEPEIASNQSKYQGLARKESHLRPIVELIKKYESALKNIDDSEQMLKSEKDEELLAMAKEELSLAKAEKVKLEEDLKVALLPKDPNDSKNVIVEIRAGTGGDEAALFAGDIFRMYSRYAENKGWKIELMDSHATGLGGFIVETAVCLFSCILLMLWIK